MEDPVDKGGSLELFREPEDDDVLDLTDEDGLDLRPTEQRSLLEQLVPIEVTLGDEEPEEEPRPPLRKVIAIAGAKGGVGKTILATNIAIYLASIGRRVVVVDADSQGASAHALLGVERAGRRAGAAPPWVNEPTAPELRDIIDTPIPGLRLMHAGIDEPVSGQRRHRSRRKLIERLSSIDADYLVVDLGSGTRRSLLDFWLRADVGLFVTAPEPTALDNTYRFIRAAFARALLDGATNPDVRRRLRDRLRAMGNAPAPLDLVRRLDAAGDPLADHVRSAVEAFPFRFVLSQTRLRADLDLGDAIRIAGRRRMGLTLDYLGYIDYDDTVWTAVRMRRPLLVESPGAKASKSIEKIARRALAVESGKSRPPPLRTVPPESHHDLLEVDRGATDEEIRRAYKRMREIYAADSMCCYALFDVSGMDILRARLDEAHDVLLDPARRRPYELSVFPSDPRPVQATPSPVPQTEQLPPAPILTPDTEFTGALLRAVRESQGIALKDIATRTKIGVGYLRAIEHDDFGSLPAVVYVRGFVTEVAKVLRLDPVQVSRTYVRRVKRQLEERV